MTDRPIHLHHYKNIVRDMPHHDPSVEVPVWITQSSLDGMITLMNFCDGFEKGGNGKVPGSFELLMFYRTIRDNLQKANELVAKNGNDFPPDAI